MEERIITYYAKSGDSIEIPEETIHEYHITPEDDREAFIDEIYPNFSAQVEESVLQSNYYVYFI